MTYARTICADCGDVELPADRLWMTDEPPSYQFFHCERIQSRPLSPKARTLLQVSGAHTTEMMLRELARA